MQKNQSGEMSQNHTRIYVNDMNGDEVPKLIEFEKEENREQEIGNQEEERKRVGKSKKRRTDKWSIFYSNVQGIKSKRNSLINIFEEVSPQIALVTETHLTLNSGIRIEGYTFVGKCREKKSGGGAGIFVENKIKGSVAPYISSREIEMIWVSVKRKGERPFLASTMENKKMKEKRKILNQK